MQPAGPGGVKPALVHRWYPNLVMSQVINIDGVLVARFVGEFFAALVVLMLLRPVLAWIGFQRWVWNPPLAELGLLACILGIIMLVA